MGMDRRTRPEVFATSFPIGAGSYRVSEPVPPHVHDFLELAVVSHGRIDHRTAGGVDRLDAGAVVLVRPGGWHAYDPVGLESAVVSNAYLGPELLHGRLSWVLDHPSLARLLLLGGRLPGGLADVGRDRITGWLGQLAEEQRAPEPQLLAALLTCVLVELSRAAGSSPGSSPPAITGPVRQVLQWLADDLAHPWSVPELAERARLSPSSLYRQFRSQLGTGPVDWLTRSRAERAATLLSQTDLPVAAVGRRVGWPDPSYASRRFCRVYGVSPSAYRAAHARP